MAWVTPSNVATGDVLTASTWNQDVVANTNDLRARDGLVLIQTVSYTAQSAVNVNGVFTADYRNYLVLMDHMASTTLTTTMRLRASGSDNSAANYSTQNLFAQSTTVSGSRTTGSTDWNLAGMASTSQTRDRFYVYTPQVAVPTGVDFETVASIENTISVVKKYLGHTASSSFDGFSISCTTGTITGTMSIYGFAV